MNAQRNLVSSGLRGDTLFALLDHEVPHFLTIVAKGERWKQGSFR
jgi:hypothetical protein